MKRLIIIALMALSVSAETVYVTPNGHTFHTTAKCSMLARSKRILSGDRAKAESAGLKPHKCHEAKPKQESNTAWAK